MLDKHIGQIYLDNAATTRVSQQVANCAVAYYTDKYYNPSAGYEQAIDVNRDIVSATEFIANQLGASKDEVIFTSCATESNNFALECGFKNKKGNLIISAGEHASIYEKAMQMKSLGVDVRIAPLKRDGTVDLIKLDELIDVNTSLVSIIHASNETGAINNIYAVRKLLDDKKSKALLHSDGVQAFGKIKTRMYDMGVDLYSFSAHKIGGLKGVGGLFVRQGVNMRPLILGGGQQRGLRSGTENVAGIVSFAEALRVYQGIENQKRIAELRQSAISFLEENLANITIAGEEAKNTGYIISMSFMGLKGEILGNKLADIGVIVGLGSACSTKVKKSRVLSAMGVADGAIGGSIRVSFNPQSDEHEVMCAMRHIVTQVSEWRY